MSRNVPVLALLRNRPAGVGLADDVVPAAGPDLPPVVDLVVVGAADLVKAQRVLRVALLL